MSVSKKYWKSIANRIATDFKNGHPENWKKRDIELFLTALQSRLEQICRGDKKKTRRCGVPTIKGEIRYDKLTLSYDAFRRIFIVDESEGNQRTKEMFAIYFGYDSFNDYLIKNDIKADDDEIAPIKIPKGIEEIIRTEKNKWSKIVKWIAAAIIIFIILFWFKFCNPFPQEQELLLFGHETGVAILNVKSKKTIPLITNIREGLTGIEVDVANKCFFWANWSSWQSPYISKAYLNSSFTGLDQKPIQFKFIDNVGRPAGIALNPVKKRIYCALYGEHTIAEYDYNGELINRCLIEGMKGRPSSVELDIEKQILYWTDVENNTIGKFNLDSNEAEINFIADAGPFPDGLSIDPVDNKLYWTNVRNNRIGWTDLSNPEARFIPVELAPSATKVDAANRSIYYSAFYSNVIIKGTITKNGIIFNPEDKFKVNNMPAVIKLIKIKR
ncbi:MAG: hypothetical protein SFU99_10890 [Saprospiraceae bacterium]|nr:hypothetical protein [Saprospiraceae bacterium]